MTMYYLYHICRESAIGDLTEGYVGITTNTKKRWSAHRRGETNKHIGRAYKKYGDIVEYVVTKGDSDYCRLLEFLWRPLKKVGWNIAEGGGLPPNHKGFKRSDEFRRITSERQLGELNHAYGKVAHNKGKTTVDYTKTPCRRDRFKVYCSSNGTSFDDYEERFHEWKVKPSGIRYRTYTYHKKVISDE